MSRSKTFPFVISSVGGHGVEAAQHRVKGWASWSKPQTGTCRDSGLDSWGTEKEREGSGQHMHDPGRATQVNKALSATAVQPGTQCQCSTLGQQDLVIEPQILISGAFLRSGGIWRYDGNSSESSIFLMKDYFVLYLK
ncbi:hypothetical protein RRG08_056527 [Elysia crispata]|uniref:Uncharacterized protein n=1 Tax=Elysia crispata TaxID=231223 RepID=A0AAE1DI14_9GAST|nr:hypothetical protein RRG08_056527 [Elysia crispata]